MITNYQVSEINETYTLPHTELLKNGIHIGRKDKISQDTGSIKRIRGYDELIFEVSIWQHYRSWEGTLIHKKIHTSV